MLLLHNYICRSLRLLSQDVRMNGQMAQRRWQVRWAGKAISLPSSWDPMPAGPQWNDSFPSEVWGAANFWTEHLVPAHLSQSRQGSHCTAQELLGQVSLSNLTDLDSAAVPLQLQVNSLLANLFIPGFLEEKMTGPLLSSVLEDNSSGRVMLADLGQMREHLESKKVQIFHITQFSSYSKYKHEFYAAN